MILSTKVQNSSKQTGMADPPIHPSFQYFNMVSAETKFETAKDIWNNLPFYLQFIHQ